MNSAELIDLVRDANLSVEQQAALLCVTLHLAERAHIAETALAKVAGETATAQRLLRQSDRRSREPL